MTRESKCLLFVCTGNYYRSRLAEELFNHSATERKLPWRAISRAIWDIKALRGTSEYVADFLDRRQLGPKVDPGRNPVVLQVADLENAELTVVLNRNEHEPMLHERFGQIPKIMAQKAHLRYWHVCDVPNKSNSLLQFIRGRSDGRLTQPPESSTEHIDFAVRALIQELEQN